MDLTAIVTFIIYSSATAQDNLSKIGTATQSSTYGSFYATLAVTGGQTNDFNSRSCSHTEEYDVAPWWMLSLPNDSLFIEQVNIYYRRETPSRLDGYYLYLSNTSISGRGKQTPPGTLCYNDPVDGKASIIQKVVCITIAQYVIIYNDHTGAGSKSPFLELCDVQVMGCPKHLYGQQCNKTCSVKCFEQHCLPSNGSCVLGCNCFEGQCDGNETCTRGCKKGFAGEYCNETCSLLNFGENCQYTCHCENQHECDDVNGTCINGVCQKGWQGNNCSIGCSSSTFGENCIYTCHCENQQKGCDSVSGTCQDRGCQKGWSGNTCSKGCELGRYGYNCNKSCDGCMSKQCNTISGECENKFQCELGWIMDLPFCSTECPSGTFGYNCTNTCHCMNSDCNRIDGVCPSGRCDRGWQGANCSTECPNGTFGFNCKEHCNHCLNNTCNKLNGSCTYGCDDGYQQDSCEPFEHDNSMSLIAGVAAPIFVIAVILTIFILRKSNLINCNTCEMGNRNCQNKEKNNETVRHNDSENPYEMTEQTHSGTEGYGPLAINRNDTSMSNKTIKESVSDTDKGDEFYEMIGQTNVENNGYNTLTVNSKDKSMPVTKQEEIELYYNNDAIYDIPDLERY